VRIEENNAQLRTKNIIETEINMKRTLITAAVLAALAGTQAFAQNTKQGVITFALTGQRQVSVSTSKNANNVGTWDQYPSSYKTQNAALNTLNVLQSISMVLHGTPSFYSSKAQLVLVQGELSGFFNVTPDIASVPWGTSKTSDYTPAVGAPTTEWGIFDPTATFDTSLTGGGTFPQLATGRHYEEVPAIDPATGAALQRAGAWPVGHHQPWGQIFVQDTARSPMLCENVTFFFAITVEECYDCFYLNSFISDASFAFKAQNVVGPPCCSVAANLTGNGKDRYYMTLTFDNTVNNPSLDLGSAGWIGWGQNANPSLPLYNQYAGVTGLNPSGTAAVSVDGIMPDGFQPYQNSIVFRGFIFNPYVLRFTLNGIVTYTWNLKLLNKSDVLPDFLGTGVYACNGYGFVGLYCSLFTGTANIAEKLIRTSSCCLDLPWYDSWYGPGWDQVGNSTTRATPVNIESSLTYHAFFDEEYEPGEQWGTNPASPTGP
jgi:hypothetical protein